MKVGTLASQSVGPFPVRPSMLAPNDKLFAPVAVTPPELDISAFSVVVVLFLVKSKAHRPSYDLRGVR